MHINPAISCLDFTHLLTQWGLDPASVLIIRHQARDAALNNALPWLAQERRELWDAYQRVQWPTAERVMARASHVAVFIGLEPGEATFTGLYRIDGHRMIDREGYEALPGYAELMTLGMAPADRDGMLDFDLKPLDQGSDLIGKLTIGWSKGQTWARWAGRTAFPITQLTRDSQLVRAMPDWTALVLAWRDLQNLPRSWTAALSQWRGIYWIFDTDRRLGYVGSAYGAENIFGRWRAYGVTGHGGNLQLRTSRPEALRFSILELTAPTLEPERVIALENSWKARLSSRDHGLNSN